MITRRATLPAVAVAAVLSQGSRAAADVASVPAPTLKAGETWVQDSIVEQGSAGFAETHYAIQVEEVRSDSAIIGIKRQGAPTAFQDHEVGLDWTEHRLDNGVPVVAERPYDFPLVIGKTWVVDYDDPTRHGLQMTTHVHKTFRVIGWEDVKTPAGAFHAMKIEARGTLKAQFAASAGGVSGVAASADDATTINHIQRTPAHVEYATTYGLTDYAPQVNSFVKSVHETYNASGVRIRRETRVLESYKPGG